MNVSSYGHKNPKRKNGKKKKEWKILRRLKKGTKSWWGIEYSISESITYFLLPIILSFSFFESIVLVKPFAPSSIWNLTKLNAHLVYRAFGVSNTKNLILFIEGSVDWIFGFKSEGGKIFILQRSTFFFFDISSLGKRGKPKKKIGIFFGFLMSLSFSKWLRFSLLNPVIKFSVASAIYSSENFVFRKGGRGKNEAD